VTQRSLESGPRTLQFLQWFIEDSVEEERTMAALIDLIDGRINLFEADTRLEGHGSNVNRPRGRRKT
jgi:ferritin